MDDNRINSGNMLALLEGYLLLDRYRIGKVLGAGGFGITYKAFDTWNEMYCAIKEYVPLGICMRMEDQVRLEPAGSSLEADYLHGRDRFMEEAAVLLEVADIPNIVRVVDYFEENGTAYYVMEYLIGSTVRQLQKKFPDRRIPFDAAMDILKLAGTALDKVHSQKFLLHRDISPENIFITETGKVKLIDFGSAKHVCVQGNQKFSVVLKPGYAPPEQYRSDDPQGCYTDVYALASTFYCMICGKMLPDSMERKAGAEYIPAYQRVPEMSRMMSAVLDRALQLDSRKRYQTVGQFIRELESARRESVVNQETGSRQQPCLILWENGSERQRWYIPEDEMVQAGRSADRCQIVITGYLEISKVHCFIQYDSGSGKYLVKDVSTNGVAVNGRKLEKEQVYALEVGCVLCLADMCNLELGRNHGQM